jgi:thiamine-monophosphate kinase
MARRMASPIERAWRTGPPVASIGEFELIERIRHWVDAGRPRSASAIVAAIGDDAALLRPPRGWDLALTCDAQIDGRHFRREWMTPRETGARAAEVNLSDIAAMGAVPMAALVSLGVPRDLTLPALRGIYAGLRHALDAHGARVIGGNVTGAAQLILDVTLVGRVESGRALLRAGARPGDIVFVTGAPGRAAAALAALPDCPAALRRCYTAPRARVAAGRFLVENSIASAAIDVSDGVGGDLMRVCEASGVAIVLEEAALPVDRGLARFARACGRDAIDWVTGPSDDYELLFTTRRARVDLALAMGASLGLPVTPIGRVVEGGPGVRLRCRNGMLEPVAGGWDHLRGESIDDGA